MSNLDEREIAKLLGVADNATNSQVMDTIHEVYERATDLWGSWLDSWHVPIVTYNLKGTTAGRAYLKENRIELNLGFLLNDDLAIVRDMYEDTIPHEMAHLITWVMHPSASPHGEHWKQVMRRLGLVPERCHNYDVEGQRVRKHKKYLYACGCINATEPIQVGSAVHNKIQAGQYYICKKCKQRLIFLNRMIVPE